MSSSSNCRSARLTGRVAVADHLVIPLDDRRNLDRAAKLQHLAARARLGHGNVADLDAGHPRAILMRACELQQSQRRAPGQNVIERGMNEHPSFVTNATFMFELSPTLPLVDEDAVVESLSFASICISTFGR
jgi:hypothetical protein